MRLCECERDFPSSLAIIIRKHCANQEGVVVHRPSSVLWGGVFCTVGFEIFDGHNIEGAARKNHRASRSRKHRSAKVRNIFRILMARVVRNLTSFMKQSLSFLL